MSNLFIVFPFEFPGTYACEVSTESPTYYTVREEKSMKIFVLPTDKIYIEGFTESFPSSGVSSFDPSSSLKYDSSYYNVKSSMNNLEDNNNSFDVGDLVNLTCVSGASKPPPKMAWFINGELVSGLSIVTPPPPPGNDV